MTATPDVVRSGSADQLPLPTTPHTTPGPEGEAGPGVHHNLALESGDAAPVTFAPAPHPNLNRGAVDPGSGDLLRVMALVVAAGGDDAAVRCVRLNGDPWSKARPRHTKRGFTYQRPEDRAAENRTRAALSGMFTEVMTGNIAMAAIFYRSNRQRIDADNMLKHVCDAATGVAWVDDSQVTAVLGVIELDPSHPRTVLAFAAHDSTLGRGTDWTRLCGRCDQPFVVDPKRPAAKYCGRSCSSHARGHVLAEPVPCATCGGPFRRLTTAQKYCDMDCRNVGLRGQSRPKKSNSLCTTCSKELTHRRGGRCRDCWLAAPGPVAS